MADPAADSCPCPRRTHRPRQGQRHQPLLRDDRPRFAGRPSTRRPSPTQTIGAIRSRLSHHTVIVVDSRGHGRSTRDARPYGYDLMADDVVALLDILHIARSDVVGWSDGAMLGLDLAIRHSPSGACRQGVRLRRQHRHVRRAGGRGEKPHLRPLH